MLTVRVCFLRLLLAVCAIAPLTTAPALATPVTVLQGTVIDSASNPVSGAAVTLYGSGFVTVTTDASGNYTIDGSQWPYTGNATMWIVKPGYFTPVIPVNIVTPFPVTVDRSLITGGPVVSGLVTNASNSAAIANASVQYSSGSFYPGGTTRSVQTDITGHYNIDSSEFNESVAVTGPTMSVTVNASGYLQSSTASVHAVPAYPTLQPFSLTPASTTLLQGTITDSAANPVSGAAVTLYGAGFVTVNTDAAGHYSFTGLQWPYTGSATMWIVKPGYFTPVISVNITTPFPVIVDRTLITGGAVISGFVTDANTSAPIANASVQYSSGSFYPGGTTRSVQTDITGHYQIDSSEFNDSVAVSGPVVSVTVSKSGYLQSNASVHAVPAYPTGQNFPLTPANTILLQGTVTDLSTGLPLSGVPVTLYGPGFLTVNTDAVGHYSITGLQWPYTGGATMWIVKTGYFTPVIPVNLITPFPVTVDRALIPGGPVVKGAVTDVNTGAPIANASVLYSSGNFYPGATTRSVQTDITGHYSIDSADFNESIAYTSTPIFITVNSNPGYFQTTANVTATFPYPLVKDFALTPTGVTETITVATNPSGLNIAVDSVALVATQTFTWTPGNPHTIATTSLQAGPPGTQYSFTNWSNSGPISQTIVTPAANTAYTANFQTQYQLTTASNPPVGGSITAGGWFPAGNSVSISTAPNSGYQFTGFSGNLSGMTNPQPLTMNGPKSVTANFSAVTNTVLGSSLNPSTWSQSVTFTATVSAPVGGTPTGTVRFKIDSVNFGAPVTLIGGVATSAATTTLSVGGHSITADYSGDASYGASTATPLNQVVNQANQTINFAALSNQPFGAAPFLVSATASSNLPVSFASTTLPVCTVSGATVTLVTTGSCTIRATQVGDTNYLAALDVDQTFQVTQASQTINFGALSNQPVGAGPFSLSATATSSLPVTFVSMATPICTVSGGQLTLLAVGVCSIQASQAGDSHYHAAPHVMQSMQVYQQSPPPALDAYQVRYISNLTVGDSVINITNTGANGASLFGPGFGGPTGNICVNVYAFSPDEQLVSCCSCLVTPNGLVHVTANNDLVSNTLTGIRPDSLVVKLVSTGAGKYFTGDNCTNSAALAGADAFPLSTGMLAWGTTLHSASNIDPPPAGSLFSITETPFLPATLSDDELASVRNRCSSIIGNGSSFGVCRSCRLGGLGGSKM